MAEFPALPLWTDAYLGDTTHLTTLQHGAFLLLLITQWRSKNCDLPADNNLLARYTHLTLAQWLRIRPIIAPFFSEEHGRLINKRLRDELEAVRQLRSQRVAAGRSSALKRLHRGSTSVQFPLNERIAPIPIPIRDIDKSISPTRAKRGADLHGFEKFWEGCPRKVGRGAAAKAWPKARSKVDAATIIAGMRRYAATRAGEDQQFTVHPATWLNQERWLDEGAQAGPAAPVLDEATRQQEMENRKRLGIG